MRMLRPRPVTRRNESWQVIYMDLMTTIMIFFVILWSINQRQDFGVSETVGEETVKMVDLPGDILFASGRSDMSRKGQTVFKKLFSDNTGAVLNFDTGGLVKRLLVIHGHTDGDGDKGENLELGYQRALAAYNEMKKYSEEIQDHVIICTHADNSPKQEVPSFQGDLTRAESSAVVQAKARNRRIAIEDKMVSRFESRAP